MHRALAATLLLAACSKAPAAPRIEGTEPPPAAAAPAPTRAIDLLIAGDGWGEYGPCG